MLAEMILKRFLVYSIVFSVALMFGPTACMTIGKNFRYMDSFVVKIDTPHYGNDSTKKYLQYFNSLGDNKAVSFDSENGKYDRTIVISELGTIPGKETTIGQAYPRWDHCHIVIEKGLDEYSYAMVLYHEYLHCLGYSHVEDPEDLMYYSLNWSSVENLRKYAQDVKKRRTR